MRHPVAIHRNSLAPWGAGQANVRELSLEDSSGPEMYLPVTQAEPEGAELVIRTKLASGGLARTVLRTLRSLNPGQPATQLRPLEDILDLSARRFLVRLVSAFASLGLVLASLGIYGLISYLITQQTREIGLRMALGATTAQVQSAFVGRALIGIETGILGSLATARWLASLLSRTSPADPITFAGIAVLLTAVAAIAGYLPARRASNIDPVIALRGV